MPPGWGILIVIGLAFLAYKLVEIGRTLNRIEVLLQEAAREDERRRGSR